MPTKNKNYKRIDHSSDKPYYDYASEKIGTAKGRRMMRLRSSAVEPVLRTLPCFRRMRKVYTIGQPLARKRLLMAAAAYNLKKLMSAMLLKGAKAAKNALLGKMPAWNKFISFDGGIFAMQ